MVRNTGHKHAVQRVQWHRSGQAALSASSDCVCLWDTTDAGEWKKVRTLALPPDTITRAASQVMQVCREYRVRVLLARSRVCPRQSVSLAWHAVSLLFQFSSWPLTHTVSILRDFRRPPSSPPRRS